MVDYQFTLTQIDIAKEAFQFTHMILMTNITTIMVNFYYSTKNSTSTITPYVLQSSAAIKI